MADEWWISSARATDDDGNGTSPCSTTAPPMDQNLDAAESSGTSTTTATADFRPALHVDAAAPPPPMCFLADPPLQLHHMDWTQAAYICMGGRAAAASAAAGPTTSLYALLQPDGDASGRHFPLDHQQLHVDGAAPVAAAAAQSASLYASNQLYSSYGDVLPFPRQQEFSGFFGSSTRNFGDVPAAPPPPPAMTKPLLLQALEQKAFKSQTEPPQDACSSATRSVPPGSPAPAKKPRVATPSPLPTFKVRKEKLGDRITALQQLVSPFGRTDTASVLHEAIEYIRFLHDQVASLSSPYLRCGRPVQQLQQQKSKDGGEAKEDLRSRGLCLVPLTSTTYAVASETAPEFWPPTFGGTLYR